VLLFDREDDPRRIPHSVQVGLIFRDVKFKKIFISVSIPRLLGPNSHPDIDRAPPIISSRHLSVFAQANLSAQLALRIAHAIKGIRRV
jgi:hypothetical protein